MMSSSLETRHARAGGQRDHHPFGYRARCTERGCRNLGRVILRHAMRRPATGRYNHSQFFPSQFLTDRVSTRTMRLDRASQASTAFVYDAHADLSPFSQATRKYAGVVSISE
jgi:hypothetical protein